MYRSYKNLMGKPHEAPGDKPGTAKMVDLSRSEFSFERC